MARLKVRLFPPSLDKSGLAGAGRIEVNLDTLYKITGDALNGRLCLIERCLPPAQQPPVDLTRLPPPLKRQACLWGRRQVRGAGDRIGNGTVFMSRAFHDACGFGLQDEVEISLVDAGGKMPDARAVRLVEETRAADDDKKKDAGERTDIEPGHLRHWEFALADYLGGFRVCGA
jgi:hypothetical protein